MRTQRAKSPWWRGSWTNRKAMAACDTLEPRRFLAIPAFPGAEGAGAYATGGRGGDVYHVTNLNSSGAGSLADGLSTAPSIGRTIVFDVSGYIQMPATLRLTNSKITIAGQTAPGDGVGLRNGTFWISGDDVVIRHLRFYGDRGGDALDFDSGSNNSILDHVTVAFGNDENFSTWSPPENMTFQDSINAWGLQTHSCGGLWNTNHATALRTLWIHNHTRNPKVRSDGLLDWANNVTADWDIGFIMGDSTTPADWKANVRGSYFVSSYPKTIALEKAQLDRNGNPNFSLHLNDTFLDGNANGVLDVSRSGYSLAAGSYNQVSTPFTNTGIPVSLVDYLTAYKRIVSTSGPVRLDANSDLPLRDEVNAIAVDDLIQQRQHQISAVSQTGASNGGYGTLGSKPAAVDSDRDGMPDEWELTLGLNAALDDHNVLLPNTGGFVAGTFMPAGTAAGYTNLEEYLHFLATPHATIAKSTPAEPTAIDVDLAKYTSGFTKSPTYTLNGIAGGTATLLGDGHTARFVPTLNVAGRATFNFTVTDADGSTWTQSFNLLVSAVGAPKRLVWQGNGTTNLWDTSSMLWLKDGAGPGVPFGIGDSVTFDDGGSNAPNISIVGTQTASGMIVDATKNYTIGGTGSLSGGMTLQKRGTGALQLSGVNTYTGGTIVGGGQLTLANASAAGSGAITLNGSTLRLTGNSYGNAVKINQTSAITTSGTNTIGSVSGAGTLALSSTGGNTFTLGGDTATFAGTMAAGASTGYLRFYGSTGSANAAFDLGTSSLTLLNRNGNATFHLGALAGGGATTLTGASSTANASTYSIGALGTSTTFAGHITNNQGITSITKTGAGMLTLTGASSYTGATSLAQGGLEILGSLGNTSVTVAAGATLSGTGSIGSASGGAVTVASGAMISPGAGGGDGGGNLRVGNGLSLADGSTLVLDLTNKPSSAINDRVTLNGGTLSLAGTVTLSLRLTDGYLGPGVYTLVEGGSLSTETGLSFHFTLPANSRQTYTLEHQANGSGPAFIRLVVGGDPSAELIWRGNVGSSWDLNTSSNWLSGGLSEKFFNLDSVTFDDVNALTKSVVVAGNLQPRSVTVNTSGTYAISGAGAIVGNASLTKSGAGTLSLGTTSANTYAGGTFLNGGTLQLTTDAANNDGLGSGPITLANGTTLKMYDNSNSYNDVTWKLVVPAGTTATVYQDQRSVLYGSLEGGGTLNWLDAWVRNDFVAYARDFTGQLNIITDADGGDFRFGTSYSYAGFPNAVLNLADKVNAYFIGIVNSGAGTVVDIGELRGSAGSKLQGAATGGRNFAYRVGGRNTSATFAGTISEQNASAITSFIKTGTGVWTLSGSASYAGTTTIEQGTLRVTGSLVSGGGSFIVKSGATLDLAGGSITTDSITIEPGATITGVGVVNGEVLNFGTATLGSSSAALQVDGDVQTSGTLVLAGPNTITGELVVTTGYVVIADPAGTGGAAVHVLGGTVTLQAGLTRAVVVPSLEIAGSGLVQIGSESLIINGVGQNAGEIITDVRGHVLGGRLVSSKVAADVRFGIGYARSGTLGVTEFDGASGLPASAVVILATLRGDSNLDGSVDFSDLLILAQHYGAAASNEDWTDGDHNHDGFVNFDDLLALSQHYGESAVVTGLSAVAMPAATAPRGKRKSNACR